MRESWQYIRSYPVLTALNQTFLAHGSSFQKAFLEWAFWNYYTSLRADTVQYYSEGKNYPFVEQRDTTYYFSPIGNFIDSVQALGSAYHPLLVKRKNRLFTVVSNVNTGAARFDLYQQFNFLMNDSTDGTYTYLDSMVYIKISAPDPQNWKSQESVPSISPTLYFITAKAHGSGSITPSGVVEVDSATNQSFTILPARSYRVDSIVVDGVNHSASLTYEFRTVVADHSIDVYFSSNHSHRTDVLVFPNPLIYPNPQSICNDCMQFVLPDSTSSVANLFIFSSDYRKVFDGELPVTVDMDGEPTISWNSRVSDGDMIASGIYIFSIKVDTREYHGKFAVVRR
jgi:hypothetical protein